MLNKPSLTLLSLHCFMMKSILLTTLLTFFIFTGCAPKQAMIKADMLVAQGSYKDAAVFSSKNIDKRDIYDKDNLLWQLQSGSSYLFADDTNKSISHLDSSEELMKYFRKQILAQDITQTIKSTLLNDTTRPYIGSEYDGIMTNTYKALAYMKKDDTAGARVEFNRAMDRQRRAKIFFSEIIQKEQAAIRDEEIKSQKEGKNLSVSDATTNSILTQNYPSLHNYEAYPDFVNPMSTYLAGLFAYSDADSNKAYSLLKEAHAMMPQNSDVKKDFHSEPKESTVWVIFENGQAPVLKEWRIDFPIWIFTGRLSYISVALPRLVERKLAFNYLKFQTDTNTTYNTSYLCSMENVIKTEFEKIYPSIVRRAILSTATKAAINYTIQEQANKNGSGWAALASVASTIYQIASTQADTRIWSTLPKEFHLARFSRPENGKLYIKTPNNILIKSLDLPKRDKILIYVKIPTPYAKASVLVIPF